MASCCHNHSSQNVHSLVTRDWTALSIVRADSCSSGTGADRNWNPPGAAPSSCTDLQGTHHKTNRAFSVILNKAICSLYIQCYCNTLPATQCRCYSMHAMIVTTV
jgi:hypothetical protein